MLGKLTNTMTASKFRLILLSNIVLLLAISAGGFWFLRGQLALYAEQVQKDSTAASTSSNDISRLQLLQRQLEEDKVAVTRAKSIVADSQAYQYQNQIITDITSYGVASGVTITSIDFSEKGGVGGTAAPPVGALPTASLVAPAGLKTTSAVIAVKNPVNYLSIMRFVHSIESNLTKMQITGVSLQKSGVSTSEVTTTPLTIQVYTR
jgi:hypothetical protein